MKNLSQKIEELSQIVLKYQNLKNRYSEILEKYPDTIVKNNKYSEFLSSSLINKEIENYYISPSCSCCPDPPVSIYFYKKYLDINIYTDPVSFCIGTVNDSRIYPDDSDYDESYPESAYPYRINHKSYNDLLNNTNLKIPEKLLLEIEEELKSTDPYY